MPNVLVGDALQTLNISTDEFSNNFRKYMKAGVKRLKQLQKSNGGWTWYHGDSVDSYMTTLTLHGLKRTEELGYDVDDVMMERGMKRLKKFHKNTKMNDLLAYQGYVLETVPSELESDVQNLSPYALSLLALTANEAGRTELAERAVKRLISGADENHWTNESWINNWEDPSLITTCFAIQALHELRPDHKLIDRAVNWVLDQRHGKHWGSTKNTARAISTLLKVADLKEIANAAGRNQSAESVALNPKHVSLNLNSEEEKEMLVDLNKPTRNTFSKRFDRIRAGQENRLRISKGDRTSDFKFNLEAVFHVFRPGFRENRSNGLQVRSSYDSSLDSLRIGDETTVSLTVKAKRDVDYAMVKSPIPAGCEVIEGSARGTFSTFEKRYGKALFFVKQIDAGQTLELTYRIRAEFAGRYSVPPAVAELMYETDIRGTGTARTCRIKK